MSEGMYGLSDMALGRLEARDAPTGPDRCGLCGVAHVGECHPENTVALLTKDRSE